MNLFYHYPRQQHPSAEHYLGIASTREILQVKLCLDCHYINYVIIIRLHYGFFGGVSKTICVENPVNYQELITEKVNFR